MTKAQTALLKSKFLERFRVLGNITRACEASGATRYQVKGWRERDKNFAALYLEAEIEATENLEAEAYRRAVDGVEEPVYQGGHLIGTVQKYSDTLLIFLLKGRDPKKYRENYKLEHSGPAGGPIPIRTITVELPPDESSEEES